MHATRAIERSHLALTLATLAVAACGGSPAAPGASVASPGGSGGFFESAGARLNYALDLPRGSGPFPAVVIGHGSGQVTKADGSFYVPFLLERGFAVLRYDKRGAGQSTGTYRGVSSANSEAQVAELAGDMAAAVGFLSARPEIDGRRLGLMGTSQAGWVMVAAAGQRPGVRFVIAVTGSVLPVGTNICYENLRGLPIEDAYAQFAGCAPGGYDPLPTLRALRTPTLWLFGGQDRLVPTRECVKVLDALRAEAHPVESVVYPAAPHSLPGGGYWPDVDAFLARNPH